jgi:hypothetical protein
MASTRDINQPGDYVLEQFALDKQRNYMPYGAYATPPQTMFAGDGLLNGKVGNTQLAKNAVDIETFLYGIGANNLVKPKAPVVPEIKTLKSLNIIDRLPVILPEPLVIEPAQRLRLFE